MNIHVILIGYALANELGNLLTAFNGVGVTFHLFLHSSDFLVNNVASHWADQPNVRYYPYRVNRGLAKSWNEGLINAYAEGADVAIIANDDIIATFDDLLILAQGAFEHRDHGVVVCEGQNLRMAETQILQFAILAINPLALEQIGYFDEAYTPIYGEDVDWSYRAGLAGVKFYNAGPTGIIHTGSATVGGVPELSKQNNVTFQANQAYHVRKWNGGYGQEKFTIPFNDPKFNLKIAAEDRHNPYPGYERVDLDIVRL